MKTRILIFNIALGFILGAVGIGRLDAACMLAAFFAATSIFATAPSGSLLSGLAEKVRAAEERLGEIDLELKSILDAVEKREDGTRTEEESKKWNSLMEERKKLQATYDTDKQMLEQRKRIAGLHGQPVGERFTEGDKKDLRRFKISRAMSILAKRSELDGVEAEVDNLARGEAREIKAKMEGNLAIPGFMIDFGQRSLTDKERRDLTVTTEGADVVDTVFRDVIPILRPRPVVTRLGAMMLTGLTSDVQFPRQSAAATMAWEGENDANAETTPTFDNIKLQPNRVGGFTEVSKKFMLQASFGAETFVRNELNTALQLEVDKTAINGAGSGNQPAGILNTSGVSVVGIGTDGGAITYAKMLALIRSIKTNDADMGSLAFLQNPEVMAELMNTPKQTSGVEGNFIQMRPGDILGYTAAQSTQVPNNLTKGSGTDLSALIFGNFADWIIGQFGPVDLLIDPYTKGTEAMVKIIINAWFDMKARHAKSFAVIKDATTLTTAE